MREISAEVLAGIEKTHPIEAAIWRGWIDAGTAQIVENKK